MDMGEVRDSVPWLIPDYENFLTKFCHTFCLS